MSSLPRSRVPRNARGTEPHERDIMALPNPIHDAAFYAGVPLRRAIAFMVDVVIIGALVLAALVLTLGIGFFIFPLLVMAVSFAYRWLTLSARSATFGMLFMGIELRGATGQPLSPTEAAFHTGIFIALMVSIIGWVGTVIAMLATERHQGLPDLLLGTVAINRPAD